MSRRENIFFPSRLRWNVISPNLKEGQCNYPLFKKATYLLLKKIKLLNLHMNNFFNQQYNELEENTPNQFRIKLFPINFFFFQSSCSCMFVLIYNVTLYIYHSFEIWIIQRTEKVRDLRFFRLGQVQSRSNRT